MVVLNVFGDIERFTTEVLYPYRYVITPMVVAAVLAAFYMAYRLGLHSWVRRHPLPSAVAGVPAVVVLLVAGNYFLSPLWERSFLEEESPLAAVQPTATHSVTAAPSNGVSDPVPTAVPPTETPPTQTPPGGPPTAAFAPGVRFSGMFVGADDFHFGRGDAQIIETQPGVFILRFENFSVRNGPDLFVYLSEDPSGESVKEALNLGALKATDGAFNYEIPPEIDVSRVKSAVVWCRQFAVLFTHAELSQSETG